MNQKVKTALPFLIDFVILVIAWHQLKSIASGTIQELTTSSYILCLGLSVILSICTFCYLKSCVSEIVGRLNKKKVTDEKTQVCTKNIS